MSDETTDDAPLVPGGPSKLPLILGGVNALVSIVIAVRVLTMSPGAAASAPVEAAAVEDDKPGPIHALDPFVVNLNEAAGGRFLKLVIEIELTNNDAVEKMTAKSRAIRDEMLRYLSSLTVEETMGEENKLKITDEGKKRIEAALGEGTVKRLYLVEFVVQ